MSIRSFYVVSVQSSNLAIHRYVLAFESKKKNKMRNMFSFFREQINFIPHAASSSPEPSTVVVCPWHMWKKYPFRPSISIWFLIERWSYIPMSLLPFVLRSFHQIIHPIIISIDLCDWVLPTVLSSYQWLIIRNNFIPYDFKYFISENDEWRIRRFSLGSCWFYLNFHRIEEF